MRTDKVSELTNRLKELTLETSRIISALQEISSEIGESDLPVPARAIPPGPTDRTGTPLEIGQRVRLLTTGQYSGNSDVVTKIGKTRVHIRLDKGKFVTNRAFHNVQVVRDD